jgi:hypothetical protein
MRQWVWLTYVSPIVNKTVCFRYGSIRKAIEAMQTLEVKEFHVQIRNELPSNSKDLHEEGKWLDKQMEETGADRCPPRE